MKLIPLFFFLCVSLYAVPSWYYEIKSKSSNVIIGYGSGSSESTAKQEAFNDIAGKLSTTVETSMKLKQIDNKDGFKESSEFKTSQKSNAILSDYKLLKLEYNDGKFYIALEYENIPSLEKFVNKVKHLKLKNEKQNSYLKHTLLSKKLKKLLGYDIKYQLIRKDKNWYVKYKKVTQVLDKKDFAKLFVSVENKDVKIKTNKKRDILYDGDKFYFKVISNKKGFVSILTVYEDGTVATLVRNIPIIKDKLEKVPDEDFETIPEAGLIKEGIETFDLYALVYSNSKLRFDNFAYADSELINEEKYKNFDELIEFLDDKKFTTLKVVTKPR